MLSRWYGMCDMMVAMKHVVTRQRRPLAFIALLGVAAFLLTGCIKMQADFVIKADDTFDATIFMGYSDEAMKQLSEMSGQSIEDMQADMGIDSQIDDLERQFGADATVETVSQDGYTGSKITIKNQPLSDISSAAGSGAMSIVREGDTFVLSGNLDMAEGGEGMDGLDAMGAMGIEMPVMIFTFTFPGAVKSSSGEINGNTATFNLDFGKSNEISAEAEAIDNGKGGGPPGSGGGISMMLILIIAGAVIVVAAVVLIIVLRSKKKKAAAPMADAAYSPPGSFPAQQGYPPQAPPAQGYPPQAPPVQGYPPQAPPVQGYPPQAPPQAPPVQGYPPQQ